MRDHTFAEDRKAVSHRHASFLLDALCQEGLQDHTFFRLRL
jgi:hypothetical protein